MKNIAIKGKYTPQNKSKFLSRRKPVYRSMGERRFMIYCDNSESILEWDSESIHMSANGSVKDKLTMIISGWYEDN